MSSTLPKRIQFALEQKNLSWSKAATSIGLSAQAATKWKKGQIGKETLQDLAKFLEVDYSWLATGEGKMASKPSLDELRAKIAEMESKGKSNIQQKSEVLSMTKPVPVLSWVAAGSWSEANTVTVDDAFDWLPRPMGLSEKGFALKVQGESMLPEFRPDDYIYVEPEIAAIALKNADLVVVQKLDGKSEATFKQLIIGDTSDDMYLKPLNPEWHEQKMLPLGEEWHLVGKVVGKYVKY